VLVVSTEPLKPFIIADVTSVATPLAFITIELEATTVFKVAHWSPKSDKPLIASEKAIAA